MKPFLELREGDPVWTHPSQISSVGHIDYKLAVVVPGKVIKRSGGWLRCKFGHAEFSVKQALTNRENEHEFLRFVYGEYGGSRSVYSSERGAHLGLWALMHRHSVISRIQSVSQVDGEKLLAIAKLVGYPDLPEGLDVPGL